MYRFRWKLKCSDRNPPQNCFALDKTYKDWTGTERGRLSSKAAELQPKAVPVVNSLSTTPCGRMGEYRGIAPAYLISASYGGELSASPSGQFTSDETAAGTHPIEDRERPEASLDTEVERKIFCPCQDWNLDSSVVWWMWIFHVPIPNCMYLLSPPGTLISSVILKLESLFVLFFLTLYQHSIDWLSEITKWTLFDRST
jgi:hypothetical protein